MKPAILALCLPLLLGACASLDPQPVADLAEAEKAAFDKLNARLAENRQHMQEAARIIAQFGGDWEDKAFELDRKLAKARRLDEMRAPWAPARDEMAATQRAVILYHLYEVELAEQKVLEARMAQRRARAAELLEAYDRHAALLGKATANLKTVINHLNQPKSAQIGAFAATFLEEVTDFREGLEQSSDPRLQALSREVSQHEAAATEIKQKADEAMKAYMRLQEASN